MDSALHDAGSCQGLADRTGDWLAPYSLFRTRKTSRFEQFPKVIAGENGFDSTEFSAPDEPDRDHKPGRFDFRDWFHCRFDRVWFSSAKTVFVAVAEF
jgi:hypothetical protein